MKRHGLKEKNKIFNYSEIISNLIKCKNTNINILKLILNIDISLLIEKLLDKFNNKKNLLF
jgi:predicted CopG family antitoxin